jgi:hypothetical protein
MDVLIAGIRLWANCTVDRLLVMLDGGDMHNQFNSCSLTTGKLHSNCLWARGDEGRSDRPDCPVEDIKAQQTTRQDADTSAATANKTQTRWQLPLTDADTSAGTANKTQTHRQPLVMLTDVNIKRGWRTD